MHKNLMFSLTGILDADKRRKPKNYFNLKKKNNKFVCFILTFFCPYVLLDFVTSFNKKKNDLHNSSFILWRVI